MLLHLNTEDDTTRYWKVHVVPGLRKCQGDKLPLPGEIPKIVLRHTLIHHFRTERNQCRSFMSSTRNFRERKKI